MKIDLTYVWRYWDLFSHVIQKFGAHKENIAKRISMYVYDFKNDKLGLEFAREIKEIVYKQNGFPFLPYTHPERGEKPPKRHSTLIKDWKDSGVTFGPGGIDCACCAPPRNDAKKLFREKLRMNKKKIIRNEMKEMNE